MLSIDYRGYNRLPKGATSQFNVEYFFAGGRGPAFRHSFWGALDNDYFINKQLQAESLVWSPCGADVNLRMNSSMRVNTWQTAKLAQPSTPRTSMLPSSTTCKCAGAERSF